MWWAHSFPLFLCLRSSSWGGPATPDWNMWTLTVCSAVWVCVRSSESLPLCCWSAESSLWLINSGEAEDESHGAHLRHLEVCSFSSIGGKQTYRNLSRRPPLWLIMSELTVVKAQKIIYSFRFLRIDLLQNVLNTSPAGLVQICSQPVQWFDTRWSWIWSRVCFVTRSKVGHISGSCCRCSWWGLGRDWYDVSGLQGLSVPVCPLDRERRGVKARVERF